MNPQTKEQEPLTGKFFKHADVEYSSSSMEPIVSIKFDDIGAKMFEEITARLVNKPLAIFVGGDLISSPNVREKISGGSATITGNFTPEEAGNLARDLNAGAIPAPITLVGEQQVGAQLGNDALNASIKAGMWGVIILILFLIFFYRLPGLVAGIALGVYIIMFIAFIKLWPGMVLSLAGVAGAILSIGMAVDANVLIFERLKEELKAGKGLTVALKAGFERAWTSIRDSNTSSLFTAFILLWFGSSIIRGFAFMLIVGIVLSLFSAIFTTRTFLQIFMGGHDVWKNLFWWGLNKKKETSPLPESTLEKK
jgi:protein-export membrane protein SecD